MTVFVYDNTKIDEFVTFNGGDVTVASTENIDYGDINQTAIIERDANYFNLDDWGRLIYADDIVPFGPIRVVDGRDEFGRSRSQVIFPSDNTVLYDVGAAALTSPVRIWVGSGTIHEIGSGLERLVIPDLGAAGPVIFTTTGVANESYSRTNYNGSGAIAKSGLSATELDQVYPWNGSGTLTVSGTTSTPYQDAYNPVIKNAAKIKGGYGRQYKNERVIYDYARDPDDKWDIENNGVLVIREGSSFDDKLITFDETIIDPLGKERSFADADALDYADYGNIIDNVTSSEDRGIIPRKFGGQISLHEYQAYGISAGESRPFHYAGSGSIFKLAEATDIAQTPVVTGSGTGWTFTGTNWFSQAPQSTFFGLEGKATISGSADERFVPQTPESTVLFDTSGTGAESIVAQTPDSKITVRLTGSVSGIAIVTGSGDKSGTVLFDVSGGATKVATAKADGNINLFDITGGMTQFVPVFTPSWFSPLGNLKTEEIDWGLCIETPTQPSESWGPIVTNDETIPKEAENWGFLLPEFNWMQLGGEHYPSLDSFSEGDTALSIQTLGTTGIATFLLSEDPDVAAAIAYESSGKSGIATHNAGLFFSGELWLSQAPQHTVFGEEGKFTFGSTGNESITPWIPEGSGSLFAMGGSAESTTKAYLQGDYSYLGGTAGQTFSPHIDNTVEITLSQGREPGQTYARIVDTPEDAFGGDINVRGSALKVTNTDAYNESSIFYGEEDENWGILDSDVSYGFGLNNLGTASGTETFDDEGDTYDQDITFSNGGLTYDQGSGGNTILPSFDKTDQYDINFADTVVSQNWGVLGISSAGGPPYDQELYPSNTGFVQQDINNGYNDYGWVNESTPVVSRFPFGSVLVPQPQPRAKTMWIPKWNGSGTLIVQGSGDERVAVASSTTSLFDFVGTTSPERFVAQTPDNTVLYDTSGTLIESVTKDFVGTGSIALTQTQAVGFTTYRRVIFPPASGIVTATGTATEKWSGDPPEGTYLHIVGGGYTLNLSYATQSTKAVQRLSGELVHPQIDFTPHYGIDRNIGIETGFTLQPGGGTDRITGITTAVFVPKYPGGQSLLDGFNGHTREVIKLDGRSISRTNAPISTHGVIYILGIGTAGNGVGGPDEKGDLEGVEFGAKERFIPATEYGFGSIMFDFTGGAESREINVFGYYGDDKDPGAGTSGRIDIRQEGGIYTLEKITKIYETDATGTYTFNGGATDEATTFSEVGSGSLYSIGGASENKAAAELSAGTSIFNGTAEESFTARDEVPWYQASTALTLSGTGKAQRRFEPVGSGTLTLSNSVEPVTGVSLSAIGSGTLFGFGSGSEAIPYRGFASSVLVDIAGEAQTREIAVYQDFITSGSLTFAGALAHPLIDFTPAETGGGFSTFFGTAETATTPREVGVGTFTASGSAIPTFTSQGGEGTVLFDLKGASAITKLHWLYLPTTSGVTTLSGAGDTKEIQTYGYYGDDKDPGTSGTFTFSNTPLVHPFVDFTPSIGIGSAVLYSISGGSTEKRAWAPVYGTGYFKNLASSKEAYGKGTYVGIGKIQPYGLSTTEYLVFEEGRVFVVII